MIFVMNLYPKYSVNRSLISICYTKEITYMKIERHYVWDAYDV